MRFNDKKFVLMFAFILLGVLLAVQFRSTLFSKTQKASSALSVNRLVEQLNREKKIEEQLRQQINENISQKDLYQKSFLQDEGNSKLEEEWESTRVKAGLTDMKGEGITIELNDAPAQDEEYSPLLLIHADDMRIILNELKLAGAQAISINGERVLGTSEMVCAGPTVLVNGNRYAVPFVITAVGNEQLLYEAMTQSERIHLMIRDKIRVEITRQKELVVPKFNQDPAKFITGLEAVSNEIN